MKKVIIAVTALLLAIFSSSCEREMLKNKLIVGSYIGETDAVILIAENEGLFKKYGLNVEIKKYEAGLFALEGVLKGEVDLATPSEVAFVGKSFDNPDIKIVSLLCISKIQAIVVRSDSGIKTPVDLKGKKIGTTKGTSAEFALSAFLAFYNINIADVVIVNLKPNDLLNAMKNKEIDGALSWEPNIYNIKQGLKNGVIDISQDQVPALYSILVSKDETIKNKQPEIEAFLASLRDAEEFLGKNAERSKTIVKGRMGATDDYIEYAWKNIILTLSLPQDIIFAMESEAKWRINTHLTKDQSLPNYVKYIYFDGLEKIKPDSITIIR